MTETRLYISRHGKTMFNTIGRIQGWADTPLTKIGEEGIRELGLGLKDAGLDFQLAVSSDLGRTVQTITIAQRELGILGKIPYYQDKRIREWCFGSFDGAYGGELFHGVVPRVLDVEDYKTLTLEDLANGICQVDTANWAEPWEVLKNRILEGFEAIAKEVEENGGGNALVVSHSWTIQTLVCLIEGKPNLNLPLSNGSVTLVEYEDGKPTSLLFDRKFESGDIIVITWFNNDLGTLLEKDDIIELTDDRYVSKGSSTEVTGDVALTDFDKIGWPNVEKVDSYTRTYNSISSIFDSIYPVGSIYENAINPNNPVTYMGFGSWKLFGKGQVLVGWNDDVTDPNFALNNNDLDSSGNPSHTAGGTVGTTSVTLENANLPATKTDERVLIEDENGSVIIGGCQYDPDETGPIYTKYREDYATTNSSHTPPTNISNIQPSITVYRWIRIA